MSDPAIVQALVSILSIVILVKTVTMRSVPKTLYFLPLALAVFLYATGYLMETEALTFEGALFSRQMQYYGVATYSAFYYLFVRDFGNRPITGKWKIASFFILPALVIVLVFAWPSSKLYFTDLAFLPEPTPHLVEARGPMYLLFIIYSYGLIVLSMAEILLHYPRSTKMDRRARWLFLAATAIPSFLSPLLDMSRVDLPMQFGSMSLVLTLLVLGIYILRNRTKDWLPFARERMVEGMKDGFVLLDNDLRYLDANEVAKGYFPSMKTLTPGSPISMVPRLPDDFLSASPMDVLALETDQGEVMLQVSATPMTHNGQQVCVCVMFYDVTQQRKMVQELEYLATRDTLTGLLNRGAFFHTATRDFDVALRAEQDITLMMLDIDLFKNVNDCYGHQKGDEVLARIAGVLRERTRGTDLCGRYGGEEFCMMLPTTGTWGAMRLANQIRNTVHDLVFEGGGTHFNVTVSIGIAQLDPTRHIHLDDLIADADAALYEAKETGRNRVIPYRAAQSNIVVSE